MTLIASPFAKRTQRVISHQNESQVQIVNIGPNDLIYVCKSELSDISIHAQRCMKVIVESSKQCQLNLQLSAITTGFVEMMNCEHVKMILSPECTSKIKTIQLDSLKECEIEFHVLKDELAEQDGRAFSELLTNFCNHLQIVSNIGCENVKLTVKTGENILISETLVFGNVENDLLEHNRSAVQFKSRFDFMSQSKYLDENNKNSSSTLALCTDLVLREGGGYISTLKEKQFKDRIQQEFDRRMEQFLNEQLVQDESHRKKKQEAQKKSSLVSQKLKEKALQNGTQNSSFLDQIKNFKKDAELKSSETHETSLIDMVGNIPVDFGKNRSKTNEAPQNDLGSITGLQQDVTEYQDDEETIREKAKQVASLIRNSKHCCVYTGAGISTSSKIPDYRGPKGVWTLRSAGKGHEIAKLDIEQALPTFAHYALTHLVKKKMVKFIVSTNVDGLHRRSGLTASEMSELHGNCYREVCEKCSKEYLRGFDVMKTVKFFQNHKTGRFCEECGGCLKDTIIHFGENLPTSELQSALHHSQEADFTLVLGTSMMVQPACHLPLMTLDNSGVMSIVNLQKTQFDHLSKVRVFAKTDEFMKMVMEELGELEHVDTSFDAVSQW
ncbi:hypothetical protein C9374_010755 [Naegleria lovaniensis]|uniref:protein acetyllysine N-acetyltransferase n=1 Tax=Naegleria lovaniensis TaxID=51637 RepID=A0AA88GDF0_NAELO|nr:uncharacterized protein C9374_010755 [Naegleria lovaniensis]KAG2374471.1 hypothetical protein C9374_010755 [Naegleria lovaniensis]